MKHEIGSYQWTKDSKGILSFKEKISIIRKSVAPAIIGSIKSKILSAKVNDQFTLDKIIIPDTHMISVAQQELEAKASESLIYHSWRTYFWGAALAKLNDQDFDPEILLASSLYHDIGFTESHRHSKGCQCFTLESADQFEKTATSIGFDLDKTIRIKDAICKHINGYQDPSQDIETTLLQQGAACDVIGEHLYLIPPNYQQQLLTQYPRADFNQTMKSLVLEEKRMVPHSRSDLLCQLGFPLFITLNPFKE